MYDIQYKLVGSCSGKDATLYTYVSAGQTATKSGLFKLQPNFKTFLLFIGKISANNFMKLQMIGFRKRANPLSEVNIM